MRKLPFHILFWLFVALYDFDYLIDLYDFKHSILYTLFEVAIYMIEFYVNLLLLLPLLLGKRKKFIYTGGVVLLLGLSLLTYFIGGLNEVLLSSTIARAVSTFFLNHSYYFLISYFVWYFDKFEKEKQKRLQVENEKLQSEMLLLKSQISPHFLFNALNNIYALTLTKNDDAPKMIIILSAILRYFIYEGNKKLIFLESELEIISKYLQIQKFRKIPGMENIRFNTSGSTLGLKVPPLIYMTLIENAFKHGDIVESKDGFVTIGFTIIENKIIFDISNSYQSKKEGDGIGLKNVRSQLNILFANAYEMDVRAENCTFNVRLTIDGTQNKI